MTAINETKSKLHFIKYTLSHAPWALITSFSMSFSNYLIIILISKFYSLADGGQFRLLMSAFTILGLFTLMDSGKVLVKYLVQEASGVARTLYRQRIRWSFAGMAIGFAVSGWFYSTGDDVWIPLLVVSICLPLTNPATLFIQVNQAKRQFRQNAFRAIAKWGTITSSVAVLSYLQVSMAWVAAIYFMLGAFFNLLYLSQHDEFREPETDQAPQYRKESIQLSGTGVFTILLDDADKFLISYFLGLHQLGLYVVGISTGRLLLNVIKPTLTIYFPLLVKQKFSASLLVTCFLSLTAVGVVAALLMRYYFELVLGEEYLAAYPLSSIVLAGLGMYFVGTIFYYSAVYHKDSEARIPAISNVFTFAVITTYMAIVLAYGGEYALLLCAASYPLRELVTMSLICLLSRNSKTQAETNIAD